MEIVGMEETCASCFDTIEIHFKTVLETYLFEVCLCLSTKHIYILFLFVSHIQSH
jgi:hypothetical protein